MIHRRCISGYILHILAMWNIFHDRCSTMRICYQLSFIIQHWPTNTTRSTASGYSLVDGAFLIFHKLSTSRFPPSKWFLYIEIMFLSVENGEILSTAHWAVSQTYILSSRSGRNSIPFQHSGCLRFSPFLQQFSKKRFARVHMQPCFVPYQPASCEIASKKQVLYSTHHLVQVYFFFWIMNESALCRRSVRFSVRILIPVLIKFSFSVIPSEI